MGTLLDRPAYLLVLALATAGAAGVLMNSHRPAYSGPAAPDSGAQCEAAPATAGPAGPAVEGQIRYDSGLVLRFCSLDAMFAQLGAMEHPGIVRGVHVRAADGRWLAAAGARYGRRERGASATLRAYAQGAADLAQQDRLLSYHELLASCAAGECARVR